jgi:hypothetical protein
MLHGVRQFYRRPSREGPSRAQKQGEEAALRPQSENSQENASNTPTEPRATDAIRRHHGGARSQKANHRHYHAAQHEPREQLARE